VLGLLQGGGTPLCDRRRWQCPAAGPQQEAAGLLQGPRQVLGRRPGGLALVLPPASLAAAVDIYACACWLQAGRRRLGASCWPRVSGPRQATVAATRCMLPQMGSFISLGIGIRGGCAAWACLWLAAAWLRALAAPHCPAMCRLPRVIQGHAGGAWRAWRDAGAATCRSGPADSCPAGGVCTELCGDGRKETVHAAPGSSMQWCGRCGRT
jgi:hypothetical protein